MGGLVAAVQTSVCLGGKLKYEIVFLLMGGWHGLHMT